MPEHKNQDLLETPFAINRSMYKMRKEHRNGILGTSKAGVDTG
jgi:hypothetical protein